MTPEKASRPLLMLLSSVAVSSFALLGKAEATPTGSNLLTNGSFAQSAQGTYLAGSTTIPGWTVLNGAYDSNGSVDLVPSTGWQAPAGTTMSVDLDGSSAGGIAQTFSTVAGQFYDVSFDLSGNPAGGLGTKTLTVSAGTSSANFSYLVTASNTYQNMNYALETFSFTATASSSVLKFISTDAASSYYGPVVGLIGAYVDGSVSVPEPSSLALLSLAGVISVFARHGRGSARITA